MLTVRPEVVDDFTACADDDVAGDPGCGFRLTGGALHVCTDRDGAVIAANSDKECFAWARHQLLAAAAVVTGPDAVVGAGLAAERYEPDAADPFPPVTDRCESCGALGAVYVAGEPDGTVLCNGCADVAATAPRGPDNTIYGFTSGDPAFHTHPGEAMHFHHAGPAGHHHVGDTVVYAERAPYVPTSAEAAAARALGLAS